MTGEEYRNLVNKGKRWLMEYLIEEGKNSFSDADTARKLYKVIGGEYRRLMRDDESFFKIVESFCSKRRYKNEKDRFCYHMVSWMVKEGNIQKEMAAKHPEIYSGQDC